MGLGGDQVQGHVPGAPAGRTTLGNGASTVHAAAAAAASPSQLQPA